MKRDSNGQFVEQAHEGEQFMSEDYPDNRCPVCGQGRRKEKETAIAVVWYCSRCDEQYHEKKA